MLKRKLLKASFVVSTLLSAASISTTAWSIPLAGELEQARDKSLAYLVQNQNGDGSWGESEAEKVRVTSAVLDAFQKYNVTGLVHRRGINWLANAEAGSTDSLARQIITLGKAGIVSEILNDRLLDLGTDMNGLTVWGALENHRYSTVDTALALNALAVGNPSYDVAPLFNDFIKTRRNWRDPDSEIGSGWSFVGINYNYPNVSKVWPTAQMLLALHELGPTYQGTMQYKKSAHWMALQQQNTGAISQKDSEADVQTALAVQALGLTKEVSGIDSAVAIAWGLGLDYLHDRQETDGSLGGHLYKTALSAQAWFNQTQLLADADEDGVPDSVEIQLGTNPNVPDTAYLETGNGNNYLDRSGETRFIEVLKDQTALIQLDSSGGNLVISSGVIPVGMTINSTNGTLMGTPSTVGNYAFAYISTKTDGSRRLGAALLSVVDPNSDTDNDGMTASYENTYSSILSSLNGNDADLDPDNDGLTNKEEYDFNSNPTIADMDNDGLNDLAEQSAGTDPSIADTDADGLSDGIEVYYASDGLNPLDGTDAAMDFDSDNLINSDEIIWTTGINVSDSDQDNMLDGDEVLAGRDPLLNEPVLIVIITSTLL